MPSCTLTAALLFEHYSLTPSPCPLSGLDINLQPASLWFLSCEILSWTRLCILTLLSIHMVFVILWLDDFCILSESVSLDPLLRSSPTSASCCIQPVNPARAFRFTCHFGHRNSKQRPFLQELDH